MGITERKEREKEQRRNDIIDAAEHVFFEKGFDFAKMDDVAEKAELSKGTLYLYFKNREDLHYAIILRGLGLLYKIVKQGYNRQQNGAENLLEMGIAYVRFTNKYPEYFKAIMSFNAAKIDKVDEEKKAWLFSNNSPLSFLIEVIEKGQKDGSIRNDISSGEMSMILWSQISGVLEFIVLRSKLLELMGLKPDQMIMNQYKILLEGLKTK